MLFLIKKNHWKVKSKKRENKVMKFLVMCGLLFSVSFGYAQENLEASEIFKEANKLSSDGDLSKAIAKYKVLEDMDLSSADLYYNMGSTYLMDNDFTYAVLYLERAHKIDPSNKNVNHNLEIARSNIDSDIIEVPDFILLRIWRGVSKIFSPIVWFSIQLLFGMMMIFGIYNWKLKTSSKEKLKGFSISVISIALLLFSLCAGFTSDKMFHRNDTAILLKSGDLKSGADDRSDTLSNLSGGVKLRIKDQIGEWYKVQLINKEEGWVKVSDVGLI